MTMLRRWFTFAAAVLAVTATAVVVAVIQADGAGDHSVVSNAPSSTLPHTPATNASAPTTVAPAPTTTTYGGWVNPKHSGKPFGDTVDGLLTFRGNAARSFYGAGPVPAQPEIQWRYPTAGSMCSISSVGSESKEWCGTGWTGQPSIWERDGTTWAAFGAYDRAVHFLDAETGQDLLEPFPTGDIIKGSVSVDPDGYPLLYVGSRDNFLRVIAFDGDAARELWSLGADVVSPTLWNDDWDGSPLIVDDYMFEGGENSQIHIVKLNRDYDDNGTVVVDPELIFNAPGWDEELTDLVGNDVSIENSVAISGNTLYFANSGGLVQGWDIAGLAEGETPERVFRYWAGDDIDASITIDEQGMLYVGVEYERGNKRSQEVGQVLKLDPSRPNDPLVWGAAARGGLDTGVWATPALHRDLVIVATMDQGVIAFDRKTGDQRWTLDLGWHLWQSPVIVDDVLVMGDCDGVLHGYDVADTNVAPTELWSLDLGGCIESTPAVWDNRIIVGTRSGAVYGIG
ncbi:MAG: PQQ-binding-like beta-propeller repeat protein [Acidobacteria bacterium]|nr:PQQ-binding-like beta-propeller repeat protein [Acidobacteriota bacterium]